MHIFYLSFYNLTTCVSLVFLVIVRDLCCPITLSHIKQLIFKEIPHRISVSRNKSNQSAPSLNHSTASAKNCPPFHTHVSLLFSIVFPSLIFICTYYFCLLSSINSAFSYLSYSLNYSRKRCLIRYRSLSHSHLTI